MNFLGVVGVEEELQDNAKDTVKAIKQAGIKLWMFTGDRVENSVSVALASGIKSEYQDLYFITNNNNKTDISYRISQYQRLVDKAVLVIDGMTLGVILESQEIILQFFEVARTAQNVVACRCTPQQKTELVRLLKYYSGKFVAAVGDGANDIGMIHEADIGIGVCSESLLATEHKHSYQASLYSDFSIRKFSALKKLVLWYGRQSYRNSALIS